MALSLLDINDVNLSNGGNKRIEVHEIAYLKNFQNKLLRAMNCNGMPTREKVEKREKDACMQFIRHIYFRMASEVLQEKIAKINNDENEIIWDDLELILKMEIENPDYQTMKSFFEKFHEKSHKYGCIILYHNLTHTNDTAWPPEYKYDSFWSTQDVVGTLLNYMAEDESCTLLLKNNDDVDYMTRIYDDINNC